MLGTLSIGTSGVITLVDQLGENGSGGGTVTCTGSPTLGHRRIRILESKWTKATSTLKMEDGNDAIYGNASTYAIPHNFELANSGTTEITGAYTVTGNLTITSGTLDTTSSNHALTAGKTNVKTNGTLTLNGSTVSLSSLGINAGTVNASSGDITITDEESGWALYWLGAYTFNHNGGRVVLDYNTGGKGDGTNVQVYNGANQRLNDFKIDLDTAGQLVEWHADGHFGMDGDLTIEQGTFRRDPNELETLISIGGDLLIKSNSTFGGTDEYAANNFGSLTIDSGGTYIATSGTNTINGGFRPADVAGTLTLNGGAWAFGGTGGLFEGDFLKNAREVRINQDTVGDYVGADRVTIEDATPIRYSGSGAVTWSCWIYAKGLGGNNNGRVFDKTHAYLYLTDDSGAGDFFLTGVVDYANTDAQTITNQGLYFNTWYHVAMVFQKTGVNQIKIYVNGVEQTYSTQNTGDVADAPISDTGDHLMIGNNSGGTRGFYGQLADFKYYPTNLLQSEIAELAAKINVHPNKVTTPAQPNKIWAKLTNESTVDETGYGLTIAYTNPPDTWSSPFSVDIQDNTTTVSNLIVDSGQLNTKALDYLAFDGINDYANTTVALQTEMRSSFSVACWCKITDGVPSANNALFSANNEGDDRVIFYISTGGRLTGYYQAAGTDRYIGEADPVTFTDGQNPWRHVIFTMKYNSSSSATMKLYINGADAGAHTGSSDGVYAGDMGNYTSTTTFHIGGANNESSADDMWTTGFIRDFRIYDYDLNADQAASLYRGSYNVTPKYGWKFDDGSGNATGFGTANAGGAATATVNGTSGSATSGFVDDSTLKVNGAARVLTNGSVL